MWTRKELKTKGKGALRLNYWRSVLVSLIFLVALGGASGLISLRYRPNFDFNHVEDSAESVMDFEDYINDQMVEADIDELDPAIFEDMNEILSPAVLAGAAIVIFLILLVAAGVSIVLAAFIGNPILTGCMRFFLRSLNQPAKVGEVGYAFDHSYLNIVKTLFLRDIYLFLWGLLLIVPAFVKAYEYRMMPYILAEHPEMPTKEVFAKSKAMMKGNKWKAFVLDLSFIGWEFLSLFTAGLLHIFYVGPYRQLTNAALYESLEYGAPKGELTAWTES